MNDLSEQLCGVIGVLATPFDEDNRVDTTSIRANVRSSIGFGVSAFLVPAYAGEVDWLSARERIQVVETVLDESSGRVPVIGGATAVDQPGRIAAARDLMAVGCKAILAHIPNGDTDEYAREVREIADVGPEVLMLQEVDPVGPGVAVETLASLFDGIDCLTWIKTEVVGRYRKVSELRSVLGSSARIGTAGVEYIEALDRGVDAYMPTAYHDLYALIYNLHRAGRRDRAVEVYHLLLPMLSFSYAHTGTVLNKRLLKRMGVFADTRIRTYAVPFDAYEERIADELIERYLGLSATLAEQGEPGLPMA